MFKIRYNTSIELEKRQNKLKNKNEKINAKEKHILPNT
jgi:hypothetical protein